MKNTKTKLFLAFFISGFFLFGLTGVSEAADYYVPTTTSTVDGDTFCGGGKCTSGDTIIIRGGARGGLLFQDFDGAGSYITITNENKNPNSRVVINGMSGKGCLSILNCKYIDLRGNNDGDLTYGIKVINDNTSKASGAVRVYGESDHIKLGYLEITCEGNTSITGNGIFVQDGFLSDAWTWDTFEIHHNYIHDTRYAGMYLGQNDPGYYKNPYIARVVVHDNILKNLGTYGMVIKGLNGGPNSYYNNFVDTTGVVSRPDIIKDTWRSGIRIRTYTQDYSVDVYNNTVWNTVGPGILAGKGAHNIHDNIVCNAGTGNQEYFGHGIVTFLNTDGVHIYDNIIIQPTIYGIYNRGSDTGGVTLSRNLIGDAGLGEWGESSSGDTIVSSGADANIYYDNVADFGFNVWSDDNTCSNDDFTFGPPATCESKSGDCCAPLQTCQGGLPVSSSDCPNVCCAGGGTCKDAEICNDLIDNDGDGDIDCADANCSADPACVGSPDTCQTEGYQCCDSCLSGFHSGYDSDCPGGEKCCDTCYKKPLLSLINLDIKNPVKASDFTELIENTTMWILSIIGSLALLILIFGGVMYIGSTGDEQKVLTAKKTVTFAIIGIILVLISYAIVVVLEGILT
ncbi:hypothetical protein KAI56_03135 [Candidatus Parcubacteria bacterium]|nr:hypothetical protein [Candidatus Parcubacteria bacterium]